MEREFHSVPACQHASMPACVLRTTQSNPPCSPAAPACCCPTHPAAHVMQHSNTQHGPFICSLGSRLQTAVACVHGCSMCAVHTRVPSPVQRTWPTYSLDTMCSTTENTPGRLQRTKQTSRRHLAMLLSTCSAPRSCIVRNLHAALQHAARELHLLTEQWCRARQEGERATLL